MSSVGDPLPLIKAVLAAILLLDAAGDDAIDPDTALKGLENIAYELKQLSESDQRAVRAAIQALAADETYPPARDHVASIPDDLGLA